MTVEEIKTLVRGEQYDFLRTNQHLGENIIFLTLGGSHAYGTNVATSDVDIRGCALNTKSDLLGLTSFEQVVNTNTDTTIYSFNKLIQLLLNCNPNTIELLGCRKEHYIYMTEAGQALIDNRRLFLTKRAVGSFGGYATQQLRRLQNALAKGRMSQADKEQTMLGSMERAVKSFERMYSDFDGGSVKLSIGDSKRDDLDVEVLCDVDLKGYSVRDFSIMLNTLSNIVSDYKGLNHRNKKKDDNHLNKHAMHLIRLYLICLDILEKGDIITYRGEDLDLLMSIRNGAYMRPDGTYDAEFFHLVDQYEDRMKQAAAETALPDEPDMKKVNDFVMSINERVVKE